jgi:hypothetical protein
MIFFRSLRVMYCSNSNKTRTNVPAPVKMRVYPPPGLDYLIDYLEHLREKQSKVP